MSTSRHSQPRRRPVGRPRPSRLVRPAATPANHHHVTITPTNANYWLAHMRESASRARVADGPQAGDGVDLMADDLEACIAAKWRDAEGRAVLQWQYHMWVTPHPEGGFETVIELWPELLAA